MDLEHSGSSMRFLRATGSDIPIEISGDSEDHSSSSSDATSPMLEAELKQRAANRLCAEQLLYNSNAIPAGFTLVLANLLSPCVNTVEEDGVDLATCYV